MGQNTLLLIAILILVIIGIVVVIKKGKKTPKDNPGSRDGTVKIDFNIEDDLDKGKPQKYTANNFMREIIRWWTDATHNKKMEELLMDAKKKCSVTSLNDQSYLRVQHLGAGDERRREEILSWGEDGIIRIPVEMDGQRSFLVFEHREDCVFLKGSEGEIELEKNSPLVLYSDIRGGRGTEDVSIPRHAVTWFGGK